MVKIVAIDNEEDFVNSLIELLETKDFQVIGKGYDGKQAVNLFNDLKPDVLLLNLLMPEWDGFYAIEKIRESNPEAKIVVITGLADDATHEKLLKLNVPILYKPVDIEKLTKVINSLF